MVNLQDVKTCDLIAELKRREGVACSTYEHDDKGEIVKSRNGDYAQEWPHGSVFTGPGVTVLVVTD